jgi:TonB family protein
VTGDNFFFNGVLTGSLLFHLLVFALVVVLPAPQGGDMVTIYRVNVVEAPSRPKVRDLKVATSPLSALQLEAPTLKPEIPPPEAPEAAPPVLAAPPSALPQAPPAPTPQLPVVPQGEVAAPEAPSAKLPELPPGPPRQPEVPQPPAVRAPVAPPPPPAAAVPELPKAGPTPMEQLRSKVARLEVRLEEAPPEVPGQGRAEPRSASSLLSLRLFLNRVQEAVKRSYKFPGGFEPGLQVRIRLTIERDGSVSETEIITPSGDDRFDYAAMLALRRAKFPPIPAAVEEDRITRVISFSP